MSSEAPSSARRTRDIDIAEALEEDAQISGEACDDLVEAADYWQGAGEYDRARGALLAAIEADDGEGLFDAKAAYAQFLMSRGETEAADELFGTLLHEKSQREQTYLCAAYAYQDAGRPQDALRWLNVGAARIFPDSDSGAGLAGGDNGYELLHERHDLRRSLGEPEDAFDQLFDSARRRGHRYLDAIRAIQDQHASPIVYWPPPEFDELNRLGHVREQTHEDHRRTVEQAALDRSRTNVPVCVVQGAAADFLAFTNEHGVAASDEQAIQKYGDYLREQQHNSIWPPGRNQPCWCGSGRKYKKCCAAPGFVSG